MIIYLTENTYDKDKCIACLKKVDPGLIFMFRSYKWLKEKFDIPEDQLYYGYCSRECQISLECKEKFDIVGKNVPWKRR